MNVYYKKSFWADIPQDQRAIVKFGGPRHHAYDRLNGYKVSNTHPSDTSSSLHTTLISKNVWQIVCMLSPLSKSYMSTSALLACPDSQQNKNHDGHGYDRAEQEKFQSEYVKVDRIENGQMKS